MGINATEWAAYSQGVDLETLKANSYEAQTNVTAAQNKQAFKLEQCEILSETINATKSQLKDEQANLEETKDDITETKEKCEKDVEETTLRTLSKEITVDKFAPDQGMNCGMGMGMGDTYTSEGAISLTVEELAALDGVLADFSEDRGQADNSQKIANHLNSTLTRGATATAGTNDDGTKFVEIKRANGSSVKICDANGNGALDVKDYAFADAIKQAKDAIKKMNQEVEKIQKIADLKQNVLEVQKQQQEQNIKEMDTQIESLETSQLPDAQEEVAKSDEEYNVANNNYVGIMQQIDKAEKQDDEDKTKNNIFAKNPINSNEDIAKKTMMQKAIV